MKAFLKKICCCNNLKDLNQEELDLAILREQIKDKVFSRFFGVIKWLIFVIGSIWVFCVITQPEFILNQEISDETKNRERAKLVLRVLESTIDDEERILRLIAIEKAYPENQGGWVTGLIKEIDGKDSTKLWVTTIPVSEARFAGDVVRLVYDSISSPQLGSSTIRGDSIRKVYQRAKIKKIKTLKELFGYE